MATDASARWARASSSASIAASRSGATESPSNRSRIIDSSSGVGYPILILIMNRSTCASGRGNVPSISIGFWGRQHQEWLGQRHRHAVDGHLPLLHRLQQRRLRPRRGPVDLVGHQHLAEHRPLLELEVARLLVEEVDAHDVGRHQVGRELDSPEHATQRLGEGLAQRRLADSGHVVHQDVAVAQQRDHGLVDRLILADYHALDTVPYSGRDFPDYLYLRGFSQKITLSARRVCRPAVRRRTRASGRPP